MKCVSMVTYSLINGNSEGKISRQEVLDKEIPYLLIFLSCVLNFWVEN